MKVLLIWPKFESHTFWNFEKVCEIVGVKYMTPPLGLLTVAGLLPEEWELRLVDENVRLVEAEDFLWADVVFVGSKIVHRIRALEVIKLAKEARKTVVVGGPDPTMSPQHYQGLGIDTFCFGEGESYIPQLVADLEKGAPQSIYRSDHLPDLKKETPVPRFDLIDHRDYLYVGLQYSRGCPYNCEFCNVIDLFSHEYRTKSVAQVLAELDALYATGYRGQVDFFDDNLVGNFKQAKPLLKALANWLDEHGYPFFFSTSLTLNVAKDDRLLDLLREARFKYFLVGIESPDEEALKRAQKPHNTGFSIAEAADRIYRRAGATIHSGFLLGLDGEPANIADQMISCIDDATVPWVMAGVVYPLPGTQLANRLDREGRLFPQARDGLSQGARDQVSAGLQFRTEREPLEVLDDLVRVMDHSFDPEKYFGRCADVALRLNTIPNLFPSFGMFFRNIRSFLRLCARMLRSDARRPFYKALFRVVTGNSKGLEAFVTLSVLYLHFESMLPYVFGELARQRQEVAELGNEAWLEGKLHPPRDPQLPSPTALPVLNSA